MKKIKIGTRGSKLALWQAEYIADLLREGGVDSEIVKITTKGDKILNVSIAKIGSKGVFTEEIEEQLASGAIDIAVHSAKDMQSELDPGFQLVAFTEREIVNDVLVGFKPVDIEQSDKKVVIGTSSTRRIATLKHFYPRVETREVRGNLQTRIRKLEEGQYDALMLAYAGVKRMGYESMIVKKFAEDQFIPAVGQGSVAVEIHDRLPSDTVDKLRELLNHSETESCLLAERAYLRRLQGGCSIPVFARAQLKDGQLALHGGIVSLDGQERLVFSEHGSASEAEQLGQQLAEKVLGEGGDSILAAIRKEIG